jgi:hypothetical protein
MSVTFNQKAKHGQRYTIERADGTTAFLPSVTEILNVIGKGDALVNWAANQERDAVVEAAAGLYEDIKALPRPIERMTFVASLQGRIGKVKAWRRELDKAAEIGTNAHKLIEWHTRKMLGISSGKEPEVGEKSIWSYMAWDDWRKSVDFQPLLMEQTVWSEKYEYAGTLDLVALVGGKRTLVDYKTSKALYPETNFLQVAAYWKALEEMGHEPPEESLILRLPKKESDPEFEVRKVDVPVDELFRVFSQVLDLFRWKSRW